MTRMRRCRATNCHAMCEMPHWYCAKHIDQEADYLATRERWARGHDTNYQRKYNQHTRNRTEAKHDQYAFYRSREWQRLRKLVLDRDQHVCQYCLVNHRVTQGNTVDHIRPARIDVSHRSSPDNLATICPKCHRLKTDWENNYYYINDDRNVAKPNVEMIDDVRIVVAMMEEYHDGLDAN